MNGSFASEPPQMAYCIKPHLLALAQHVDHDADLKWHGYEPPLEAVSIEEFLSSSKRTITAASSDSASPNLPLSKGKASNFRSGDFCL